MGKSEGSFSGMDSLFSGFVLDPAKCNRLSLEEKRQLVHEIAQCSDDAPKILSSLTRGELLEIICAEMGKERKYTGFTKLRMIEHLLKLVSKNSNKKTMDKSIAFSPTKTETGFKRQRKQEQLLQLPLEPDYALCKIIEEDAEILLCENLACKATLRPEDVFCKRCSCCVCHQYDDNKDPSLWLTCDSYPPDEAESCGMSCHLKCAMKHEGAGISKNKFCAKLDGGFYCVSCGKVNELMGTWRKQLLVAKEARRVDVLCLRVSLSHKILEGTQHYKELLNIVNSAAKMLENEVGPLDWASAKMDRGIVKRLSCCTEVQKLCTSAVEAFDSMSSNPCSYNMHQKEPSTCRICFEESSPTSVFVVLEYEDHQFEELLGCRLWHRKSTTKDYPEAATYIVLRSENRFKLTDLDPSTEYFCKVSLFSNTRTLGVWEAKWVTPLSSGSSFSMSDEEIEEREKVVKVNVHPQTDSVNRNNNKTAFKEHLAKLQSLNAVNKNKNNGSPVLPLPLKEYSLASPTSNPPPTPCKSEGITKLPCLGGKKQMKENDYEYCVRVIRKLESEGHLNKEFRVRFLTWFSLKATMQERRVVNVFVDTLIDDPPSLAEQLIDTFIDEVCGKQKVESPHGFCTRLWH